MLQRIFVSVVNSLLTNWILLFNLGFNCKPLFTSTRLLELCSLICIVSICCVLFIVDFVEVLDHDLVDYLTLLQLLQETHLWTENLRIWQWSGGGFMLPPCALHCGLWGSIGPCWWTKGSSYNTDELNPLQLAQETLICEQKFWEFDNGEDGGDSCLCLGWIRTHTGIVVPW
jgi:hypothetical protein